MAFLFLLFSFLSAVYCARMPVGPPLPPPAYMVDNQGNTFGVAPDHGTLNGPVLASPNSSSTHSNTIKQRQTAGSYWLGSITHGEMPLAPSGYKFYRNVKDYGATGDGSTDDTAAINSAVTDGNRCGRECGSTTTLGALIYFPPGTYMVSSPIIQYYYTQFVGDVNNRPTIKGMANFAGIALIDTDVYIPGGNGDEWYINQNQFYRQIRNFVIDLTAMPRNNTQGDQGYVPTGIHWQVAQATSLQNIYFNMPVSDSSGATTAVGIFMENGSGGFVSDLEFFGGNIGFRAGSQQFTARNLKFTSCLTAISMIWDWGFTWKSISVLSCYVALDCSSFGGIDGQGAGSIAVVDSSFDGVPYAITIKSGDRKPAVVLDNLVVSNSASIVLVSGGDTILAGPTSGTQTIRSWAMGNRYTTIDGAWSYVTGDVNPAPVKSSNLLDGNGKIFERSKPQYETYGVGSIVNVLDHGVLNDATGDQTDAINSALSGSVGSLIFFPAGIYMVHGTVKIPVGSKIVGEGWSQIMGTGSYFEDESNPKVMVQVGNPGDSGVVELSDLLFTVKGPTAGAILMEWNVHEGTQGSAAMWDCHFRVGGAAGTNLQLSDCPKSTGSVNNACKAASLLMHVKSKASGYFENVWLWTADHDIDVPPEGNTTASAQINIYTGRGLLIESQGPTWLYGSASEHSALYQYELFGASDVYLGHMQTETPYYQDSPSALDPYGTGKFNGDPTFENCLANSSCEEAWALRVINSTNIFIYSAGLYSFFQQYDQACLASEECQDNLVDTSFTQGLWLFNLFTKGAINAVTPEGGILPARQKDTQAMYTTEISVYIPLALTGANIGGLSGNVHQTPDNVTIVSLPCTTVAPSATFTLSAACTSGIWALPSSGPSGTYQNNPPGPVDCHEVCDIFRLLSATCCGQNGNLTNPIVIPPGVPIPYDIPLPAGYTPNINITIPVPGTYDPNIVFGNGGTTTTSSTTPGGGPTGTPTSSGSSPTGTGGGGGGGGRNNGGCKDYPPGTSLQFFGANIPLPRPITLPGGWCNPGPNPLIIPGPIPLPNNDPPCFSPRCAPCTGVCNPPPPGGQQGGDNNGEQCDPDLSTETGLCANGNYPLFNPATGSIDCSFSDSAIPNLISGCQQSADNNANDTINTIDVAKTCCPTGTKRNLDAILQKRADTCLPSEPPAPPPPANDPTVCTKTYTCDGTRFKNVCANARSAVEVRGKSRTMVRQPRSNHFTAWWGNKPGSNSALVNWGRTRQPQPGWQLADCNVEEYPFASGNPTQSPSNTLEQYPVLRLIPIQENKAAGEDLDESFYAPWDEEVGDPSAGNRREDGRRKNFGAGFCIEFNGAVPGPDTDYGLAGTGADQINICGIPYGNEFLLVGNLKSFTDYDPWFSVGNGARLRTKTVFSREIGPGNTRISIRTAPPEYCTVPSPGLKSWVNGRWGTVDSDGKVLGVSRDFPAGGGRNGQSSKCELPPTANLGRRSQQRGRKFRDVQSEMDENALENSHNRVKASDPAEHAPETEPASDYAANYTASPALPSKRYPLLSYRQLSKRQSSVGGSFLDSNIYQYLATCQADDGFDPCQLEPCYADDSQDGFTCDDNGCTGVGISSQTSGAGGGSPTTTTPPPSSPTNPPPAPSPTDQVSIFYNSGCDATTCYDTWYVYETDVNTAVDVCNYFFRGHNPLYQTKAPAPDSNGNVPLPTRLGTFSVGGHNNCVYTGSGTTVGTLNCNGFTSPVQCGEFTGSASQCTTCANGEGADEYCALIYCQF